MKKYYQAFIKGAGLLDDIKKSIEKNPALVIGALTGIGIGGGTGYLIGDKKHKLRSAMIGAATGGILGGAGGAAVGTVLDIRRKNLQEIEDIQKNGPYQPDSPIGHILLHPDPISNNPKENQYGIGKSTITAAAPITATLGSKGFYRSVAEKGGDAAEMAKRIEMNNKLLGMAKDKGYDYLHYSTEGVIEPRLGEPNFRLGSKGAVIGRMKQLPGQPATTFVTLPETTAHEIGHIDQSSLLRGRGIRHLGAMSSGAGTVGTLLARDEADGAAAAAIGTAGYIPVIASELSASARGAEIFRKAFPHHPPSLRSYAGIPTYLAAAASPGISYLTKKLLGGYQNDPENPGILKSMFR